MSDLAIGEGATSEWQAAALDKETTLAFYFEVTNQHHSNLPPGDLFSNLFVDKLSNLFSSLFPDLFPEKPREIGEVLAVFGGAGRELPSVFHLIFRFFSDFSAFFGYFSDLNCSKFLFYYFRLLFLSKKPLFVLFFAFSSGKQSFLQFQTSYLHPSGRRRLRVTTLSYRFAEQSPLDIAPGNPTSQLAS